MTTESTTAINSESIVPTPKDILGGRGNAFSNHAGNKFFMKLVQEHAEIYLQARNRMERIQVVDVVQSAIMGSGARFVRIDPIKNSWVELSESVAHKKIGHAIRDTIRMIHQSKLPKATKSLKNSKRKNPKPMNGSVVSPPPSPNSTRPTKRAKTEAPSVIQLPAQVVRQNNLGDRSSSHPELRKQEEAARKLPTAPTQPTQVPATPTAPTPRRSTTNYGPTVVARPKAPTVTSTATDIPTTSSNDQLFEQHYQKQQNQLLMKQQQLLMASIGKLGFMVESLSKDLETSRKDFAEKLQESHREHSKTREALLQSRSEHRKDLQSLRSQIDQLLQDREASSEAGLVSHNSSSSSIHTTTPPLSGTTAEEKVPEDDGDDDVDEEAYPHLVF